MATKTAKLKQNKRKRSRQNKQNHKYSKTSIKRNKEKQINLRKISSV